MNVANKESKTGTTMPTRRAYNKNVPYSVKKRILDRHREGQNWIETARANEIPLRTVRNWANALNKDENGVPINKII